MISSAAPIFTVFFAKVFIKEKIVKADIVNVLLFFMGINLIIKPPFLFGASGLYNDDPEAIYAVILVTLGSIFLQANVYVLLRMLKGSFHGLIQQKKHSFLTILASRKLQFKAESIQRYWSHYFDTFENTTSLN